MVIPRSGAISANIANVYEDYEGNIDSSSIAATGIGTSLYTIVGNALSTHFGKTIVPTEGDQVTLQEITPYLGLKIPEPTPVQQLGLVTVGEEKYVGEAPGILDYITINSSPLYLKRVDTTAFLTGGLPEGGVQGNLMATLGQGPDSFSYLGVDFTWNNGAYNSSVVLPDIE